MSFLRPATVARFGALVCLVMAVAWVGCQGVNAPEPVADENGGAPAGVHAVILPGVAGPTVTLTSEYTDPITKPQVAQISIPDGVPLTLCWTAEASSGRTIAAYRYGWDVVDPDDPYSWDSDLTPYDGSEACTPPRAFTNGLHLFAVEVVDDAGESTLVRGVISVTHGPSSFDVMPGSCRNPLSPRRKGHVRTAIAGRIGMALDEIDVSTLRLSIGGNIVEPAATRVRDVTAAVINRGPCVCPQGGPDGYDDLVLLFDAADIIRSLGPVSKDDSRVLSIRGSMLDGQDFQLSDCVTIVGDPPGGDEPALWQKDAVLFSLEKGYIDRNYELVASILDDNFTFLFYEGDLQSGAVPVSQWDREHELAATAKMLNVDEPDGESLRVKGARAPQGEEYGSWGKLKWSIYDGTISGPAFVLVSLSYAEGEGTWIAVQPSDPGRYPGEVWYQKTVTYFLYAVVGDLIYYGNVIHTSFVVRFSEAKGHWQLVEWRDGL